METATHIIIEKPGSYDRLKIEDYHIEDPPDGSVQVEIMACGVNFADICVRLGVYSAAKHMESVCPGLEFAGIVKKSGEDNKHFKPGDKVFGVCRFGGYSTVINIPEDQLWHLPETWSFAEGATFPVAYLTAFHAMYNVGGIREKETALVHSAAGGVGMALLQLLKANNNTSVGIVGDTSKIDKAQEAGASYIIDKSNALLWPAADILQPDGYDIIFDANGISTLKQSYIRLKPGGRLIIYGFASMLPHNGRLNKIKLIWDWLLTPRFSPFNLTTENRSVCGFNLIYLFDKVSFFRSNMEILLTKVENGEISAMPITEFPFLQVAEAHRYMESGKSSGKIALITN